MEEYNIKYVQMVNKTSSFKGSCIGNIFMWAKLPTIPMDVQ